MSEFSEMALDPGLLKGVERMGFQHPSQIQERTIGPLIQGRDVVGQAKTGSGKTAAFGLPMLQSIDYRERRVQALVLAPTRELAVQITEELRRLGAFKPVKVLSIYGGASINVQREALRHGVHIVVGTPGRTIDHLKRNWLDLSSVRLLVIDEADTMLDMGFIDDVEFIIGFTPADRQTCLFSATMPGRVTALSKKYMKSPELYLVDSDEPSVETLDQFYAVMDRGEKLGLLVDLLQKERPRSAIVFCRTKFGAHRLASDLHRQGFDAVPLHGNLSQHQRDHHMSVFREGRADILVATDVASRGIDVSQVDCVVNYDIPVDPLLYFHRVGRTARAGRAGKAFTFLSRDELGDLARILKLTRAPISPMRPEDNVRIPLASEQRRDDRHRRFHGKKWSTPQRHKWRRYR